MISQFVICICGVAAIWLANDPRPSWRRFACIFGLMSQPAWFYTTWKAQQYGIFAVSFLYAFSWARGFYNFWIKNGNLK